MLPSHFCLFSSSSGPISNVSVFFFVSPFLVWFWFLKQFHQIPSRLTVKEKKKDNHINPLKTKNQKRTATQWMPLTPPS
jgi:hypothetical protein